MPKLPKGFGRRKSTANALEESLTTPVGQPSFRVFERPDGGSKTFDGGVKLAKQAVKPSASQRYNEDNIFDDLKGNRGSGASNSNTASTTDNSSRLSAASTAPSSTDLPSHDEWRSPHDKPYNDIPMPAVPRSATGFPLKAAGHAFSFGRGKSATPSPTSVNDEPPRPPPKDLEDETFNRPRTVTTSSYASTATPPKLDDRDLGLNLGGDFSDMFSEIGKRKSAIMDVKDNRSKSKSTEYSPTGPAVPARSYAGNRTNQPSPLNIDRSKDVSPSPYSWSSQHSHDGLIANSSPLQPQPVPQHGSPQVPNGTASGNSSTRPQRPGPSANGGLKRNSAVAVRRQSTYEYGDAVDEDARLLKDSAITARHLTESPVDAKVRDSWVRPSSIIPYNGEQSAGSNGKEALAQTNSKSQNVGIDLQEDSIFDHQITDAANLAQQYEQRPDSPQEEVTPKNKVMTPAQFERYKQEQERLKSIGGQPKDEDNEDDAYDDDDEDDDEDDSEKQRQVAKLRRKQEAHMTVYRQQMMKVTGETSSPVAGPRSIIQQSQSSPNLLNLQNNLSGSPDDEEEDEEVPLAILAAHGFPNKNRPPTQLASMSSNPNLRASILMGAYAAPAQSMAGELPAGAQGGRLPVFARNLPQDPYFGAGLVNPTNRESLALGNGAGSVNGGSSRGLPPGGLVGVIATEERSRAMRRGSPNATGEFGPPTNGFNGMGMPLMGRSMTMPNRIGLTGPMLTPGDHAQLEMAQQMQQFMQMQMQFMQMMTSNQRRPQSQNGHAPSMSGSSMIGSYGQPVPQGLPPGSSNQRTMSMLDPNAAPWLQQRNSIFAPSMQGGGYTPSIAPSERSIIGLPGRYRPVSHAGADNKSRTTTMSGALQDWSDTRRGSVTVKAVQKSGDASDEDDEEGWAAMKQQREKRKSIWRSKKDEKGTGAIEDFWGM